MNTFKDRAEALDTLVFMFEDRGLFVTADDLSPLADDVLMPAGNTEVTLACSVPELFARATQLVPEFGQPVQCAHEWCAGERSTHASLNPAEHGHASAEDVFMPGGMIWGSLSRAGAGPMHYVLDIDPSARAVLTAPEVLALADDFERHAVLLRTRAALLTELEGGK